MKGFPDLPPIWLLSAMAASWGLAKIGQTTLLGTPGLWIGAGLIAVALGIVGWSAWFFWQKRTPIEPHHAPKALIVEGPYRLSRNPIYLALLMISLGYALRLDSLLALLPVGGLLWVLDRRFASREEDGLRTAFGAAADAYLSGTRRWL